MSRHRTNWDGVATALERLRTLLLPKWAREDADYLVDQLTPVVRKHQAGRAKCAAVMRAYRATPEGKAKHLEYQRRYAAEHPNYAHDRRRACRERKQKIGKDVDSTSGTATADSRPVDFSVCPLGVQEVRRPDRPFVPEAPPGDVPGIPHDGQEG